MGESDSNYILSRDGLKLNYLISLVDDPLAMVCICHGHGEHAERYTHVMEYLHSHGVASMALDFRGHGKSEGKRGHMPSLDYMLSDIEEFLKHARLTYLECPIFLFGHSFGGCMVINFVLRKPTLEINGFIASSPLLAVAFQPPAWKVKAGRILSRLLPKLVLNTGLDPKGISKDAASVEAYQKDPLVHSLMSARFFTELETAQTYAINNIQSVDLPGLVYHGSEDPIVDFVTTRDLDYNELVTFRALEGVLHEPHNDLEKESVLETISDWIKKTLNT